MPLNSNVEPQKYMHPLFVGFLLLAISTSLTAQTWFADGHSTLDNSILSAAQISAHHNETGLAPLPRTHLSFLGSMAATV